MAMQRRPQRRRGQARPRARRKRPAGIVLHPDRLGLVVATFCATLVLLIDYFRYSGSGLSFQIVIGAGIVFVVSYGATGLFVWYLLGVRARELEPLKRQQKAVLPREHQERAAQEPPGAGEAQ